jgi:hypothetical protein
MGTLIAYLLGILTAIKPEDENGGQDSQGTDSGKCQSPPHRPLSVGISPTLSEEERAKRKKKGRQKTISFWVRIAGLIVLLVYAGFTILIWRANKKAADTAHDTMILGYRPWLGIEENRISPSSPIFYFGEPPHTDTVPSIYVDVDFFIKNFGAGPALHEAYLVVASPLENGVSVPPQRETSQWCSLRENFSMRPDDPNGIAAGQSIMPGGRVEAKMETNFLGDRFHPRTIERMALLVCIVYQDSWHQLHHSRYWYVTTHQDFGDGPHVPVPNHPEWSYIPVVGAILWGADAD